MKDSAVRNKLILATINSIEAFGIEGCTVRAIAKEAGVNLSSVHYYFESKEELVEAALRAAITGSFEDIEKIWLESMPDCKAALARILSFLFEGAVQYPGITRAEMHSVLMLGRNDGLFMPLLNAFLGKAAGEYARQAGVDRDPILLWLMQAFSTVIFLGISADAFLPSSGYRFSTPESREKLIDSLLDQFPAR